MIRRVLVALDGSPRAPSVIRAAVELCKAFRARLIPFRAIQIPPEFPPAAHIAGADLLPAHLETAALAELSALLAKVDIDCDPPVVGRGQAWRAILAAAEVSDVDLIVVGSHGYGGLDRVLGTTAAKVANVARRSVLVVHDFGAGPRGPLPADDEEEDA